MFDLPPGFRPLDRTKPVTSYRRRLPHWRQEGATYFVTFRLADSLPCEKLDQLNEERERWTQAHPDPSREDWDDYARASMAKVEEWLDAGSGSCVLGRDEIRVLVEQALRHQDGEQYALFAFVVMPNHVHALLRPTEGRALEMVLASRKQYCARAINGFMARCGTVWQEESFDRIIRDTAHVRQVVRYIEENPRKIGMRSAAWVTPAWREWMGNADVVRVANPPVQN